MKPTAKEVDLLAKWIHTTHGKIQEVTPWRKLFVANKKRYFSLALALLTHPPAVLRKAIEKRKVRK